MTDIKKEVLLDVFIAGYATARSRGKPHHELSAISEKTATTIFDAWYDQNYEAILNGEMR